MWLVVLIALVGLTEGVGWLLAAQGSGSVAGIIRSLGRLLVDGWLIYGLILWRHVPWVRRFGVLLLGTAAAGMLALLFRAMGWYEMVIATAGAYAMGLLFYAGLWLIRAILSPGVAVFAVARTLIDEAIRMKIALVPIIKMLILIAVLPFVIDTEDFLKYRITSFLTWSLIATSALLSLMTIFLAVATITKEQTQRQIFLTLTKPITRAEYLIGKWFGITLLNLLLLGVAGTGIYTFTKMLESQPARDTIDRLAVSNQVLVARQAVEPVPPDPDALMRMYETQLEQLRNENPERFGEPGDPLDQVKPADAAEVETQVVIRWYTIANETWESYRFNGLDQAKLYNQSVQLRFKPKLAGVTPDGFLLMGVRINGRIYRDPVTGNPLLKLAENNFHVLDIDPHDIDSAGGLTIDIFNPSREGRSQPSLNFNPKDGVEVLYRVGDFEANLARTLAVLWMKLMFLAMLGLAAGTYLSFPVATLVCLLVFFTAAGSSYLTESLQYYAAFPKDSLPLPHKIAWLIGKVGALSEEGKYYDILKMFIKMIGTGFMLIAPSFGEYNPTPLVSDGRLVPGQMLANAALWSGLFWTGGVGFLGWLIFRSRELARVTV